MRHYTGIHKLIGGINRPEASIYGYIRFSSEAELQAMGGKSELFKTIQYAGWAQLCYRGNDVGSLHPI